MDDDVHNPQNILSFFAHVHKKKLRKIPKVYTHFFRQRNFKMTLQKPNFQYGKRKKDSVSIGIQSEFS